MSGIGLVNSFGDITEREWNKMKRPYIAVFQASCQDGSYQETGARFFGKLYDGAYYTGYHMAATNIYAIIDDIARYHPELNQYQRGAEDPEEMIWLYG